MVNLVSNFIKRVFVLIIAVLFTPLSIAHIMVAQHGTLNITEQGVFMVVSLPVSAFEGIDDNNDGMLSKAEFNLHRPAIAAIVLESVILSDENGSLPLQGMLLTPVFPHDANNLPASQLIVMGRYSLKNDSNALRYQVTLFGNKLAEQSLEITVNHKLDGKKHLLVLTPKAHTVELFSK